MFHRTLADKLAALARQFPVVSITGPRQSRKTTLARLVFADHDYVSLEEPHEVEFARGDPKGFLRRFSGGVILDEIQRAPALLAYPQGIVDRDERPGLFIVTGSQQFHLMGKVSQTLAGRIAIVILLLLSLNELLGRPAANPWTMQGPAPKGPEASLLLRDHPAPGALSPESRQTPGAAGLVVRLLPDIRRAGCPGCGDIGNLEVFQRFVRLCAGRAGQLLNLSSLAVDCGVSHTTARHWISVLQAGFIVNLLPPHHVNFAKRLTKSPKLYFLDTGLLCYLLRIREPEDLRDHALRGPIFETYVVSELYKAFAHRGEAPPLYFWRDRTGHEVDLIVDTGKTLLPIEIKSGETIQPSFFAGLRYYTSLGKPAAKTGILIHAGDAHHAFEHFHLRPWYLCD